MNAKFHWHYISVWSIVKDKHSFQMITFPSDKVYHIETYAGFKKH